MEPKDWISRNHRELLVQIGLFLDALDTDSGRSKSKLTAGQLAGLRAKAVTLTGLLGAKEHAEATLSAAVAATNDGYNDTAAELRVLGREAQASSAMDDATRQAAGLERPDAKRYHLRSRKRRGGCPPRVPRGASAQWQKRGTEQCYAGLLSDL